MSACHAARVRVHHERSCGDEDEFHPQSALSVDSWDNKIVFGQGEGATFFLFFAS